MTLDASNERAVSRRRVRGDALHRRADGAGGRLSSEPEERPPGERERDASSADAAERQLAEGADEARGGRLLRRAGHPHEGEPALHGAGRGTRRAAVGAGRHLPADGGLRYEARCNQP
eukprot:647350-Prorocentrum_minimum.AAC.2